MLNLTPEQQKTLESGYPVECVLNETPCVVIRKEVFDRWAKIAFDDSEWTNEEMIAVATLTFDDADWAGPIE